jgi:D-alanyl-D-alanine dipeptidase
MKAARTAQNQGYRLKIYDSFRPYITTRDIFDRTELILDEPLPQQTYTGLPRSAITDLPEEPKRGFEELTYGWVMMGYNYGLNAFLARNSSSHNFGIALDLTLEDLISGEEIPMQTSMHDLSQYSVLSTNNDAANLLDSFMKKAGFGGLVSEWWHFQDNDARNDLDLVPVINGVSAECWVKDDQGWRWRDAKGSFFTGKTLEIGNKTYTFDAEGYRQN